MRGNAQTLPCDDPTKGKRSRARFMTNHADREYSTNKLLLHVVEDVVPVQSPGDDFQGLCRVRLHRSRLCQIASQKVASNRIASERPRRLEHLVLALDVQQSLEVRDNHQAMTWFIDTCFPCEFSKLLSDLYNAQRGLLEAVADVHF